MTDEKIHQHRLADLIYPVHILDEEDSRRRPGQRRAVDQGRESPPAGVRSDVRRWHRRVADTEQIIQEK